MLRLSKRVHKRERLGLNIIQYRTELDSIPNLSMVDVTYSNYGKQDRFTKHSFWMKNENVLKDINFIINDSLEKRKEILDQRKDNYYILK